MTATWLDRIGDWNPQLFRELKGRLKLRSVLLVIGLVLLAQFLLIEVFRGQLPIADEYSSYCLKNAEYNCLKDALGNTRVNWQQWWLDMFRVLNWTLAFVLMIPGAYQLVTDLEQEERRGTLNFIRLSPQTASSILTGKLLGAPIFSYLIALLLVPLHLTAAAGASVPIAFVISFYLVMAAGCYLLYSVGLLCGFLSRTTTTAGNWQIGGTALAFMLFTLFMFFPFFITFHLATVWSPFSNYFLYTVVGEPSRYEWFFLPLSNLAIAHAITLGSMSLITYWIWHALQRSFHTPGATLLNKQQSYGLVAFVELFTLGWCLQQWQTPTDYAVQPDLIGQFAVVCSINLLGFLILIAILTNGRQTLLDWARFRHLEVGRQQIRKKFWRRSQLMQDLIWGEKSPAVVAIALNLLVAAAIFVLWIGSWSAPGLQVQALLGLLITLSLLAIYAVIVQLMMLVKSPKRALWAASTVLLTIVLPPIAAAILMYSGHSFVANSLLLCSPFAWLAISGFSASMSSACLAVMGQWLVLGMLSFKMVRQLNRLGESASKPLLTSQ